MTHTIAIEVDDALLPEVTAWLESLRAKGVRYTIDPDSELATYYKGVEAALAEEWDSEEDDKAFRDL